MSQYDNIPKQLRSLCIWNFSCEGLAMRDANGGIGITSEKQPLQLVTVDGKGMVWALPASPNYETKKGRKTWTTWQFVHQQMERLRQLGYKPVLGIQMAGAPEALRVIDVDTKTDDHREDLWNSTVHTYSYAERSPGGDGLRIFFYHGERWQGSRHTLQPLECYNGGDPRFIRVTGESTAAISEDPALFGRLNGHLKEATQARDKIDYEIGDLPELSEVMTALAFATDQDKEEIVRAHTGEWHLHDDRSKQDLLGMPDVSKSGWQLSIIFAEYGLTIEGALAAMLHLKAFSDHYEVEKLERKLATQWWPNAVALVAERRKERDEIRALMEPRIALLVAESMRKREAQYHATVARNDHTLGDAPSVHDLKPLPLPDLPLVNNLRAAIAASTDEPDLCAHAINYATFVAWANVMVPLVDYDSGSVMIATTAVGVPGSGKTQGLKPLQKIFSTARLEDEVGLKGAAMFFREYSEMKSAEAYRDKPKSRRFVIFIKHDADALVKGLDQDRATAKFSGFSDTFIQHFDGNIRQTAQGAGSDDEEYIELERPRVGHAWNIQPEVFAPLLTQAVLGKGTTSRLNLCFLPKVEDDEGNAAVFRPSRFKVPTWVDNALLRYTRSPHKPVVNYVDNRDVRRAFAAAKKEFEATFPPVLHGALAHMRETLYRIAAIHDATAQLRENGTFVTEGHDEIELTIEGLHYAISFVRESYRVLHYMDASFGLGLLNETSAIRHGWKGILAHARAQRAKGVPTMQPSQCLQLSRHTNISTIHMLLSELCDEKLGAAKQDKRTYRIVDFDKVIALARTNLLDAGGTDEPYAKQGETITDT